MGYLSKRYRDFGLLPAMASICGSFTIHATLVVLFTPPEASMKPTIDVVVAVYLLKGQPSADDECAYLGIDDGWWFGGSCGGTSPYFCQLSAAANGFAVKVLRSLPPNCDTGCGGGLWMAGYEAIDTNQVYPAYVCKSSPLC
ncbi:unnamed protein product, partial [Mesorhabditis belari]|uniref:Uncharacterized protein n=1 Tax=Mesorhabditis belari TaxID=2138241 RepID=A0AAF3J3T7_9BILA